MSETNSELDWPTEPEAEPEKERVRTVVDGVIQRLSVSQVTAYDHEQYGGCERRWYMRRVLQLEEPETNDQKFGKAGHKALEDWINKGELPRPASAIGKAVRAALQYIPARGPGLITEREVTFESNGVPFIGYIDLTNLRGGAHLPLRDDDPEGTIELIDYKFVASFGYMKVGMELFNTVQMPGYGHWAYLNIPDIKWVRLSHIYITKRSPYEARKTTCLVRVDEIEERWHKIGLTVKRMQETARLRDVEQTRTNYPNACRAWQGCAFQSKCSEFLRREGHMGFSPEEEAMFGSFTTKSEAPVVQPTAPAVVKKPLLIDESTVPDAELKAKREANTTTVGPTLQLGATYLLPSVGAAKYLGVGGPAGQEKYSFQPVAGGQPTPLKEGEQVMFFAAAPAAPPAPPKVLAADAPASDPAKAALPLDETLAEEQKAAEKSRKKAEKKAKKDETPTAEGTLALRGAAAVNALIGLVPLFPGDPPNAAKQAVAYADALIAELMK